MMTKLNLGFSPCPNDTFIFHAMMNGIVDTGEIEFTPRIEDVQKLNTLAVDSTLHVTKLSFYAWLKLMDRYEILDSGSALGFGCGPLVVTSSREKDLSKCKIAVPGELTTANLLYNLWSDSPGEIIYTRFDIIMPGVMDGTFDAGVIIHEGRFVYEELGLQKLIDLGEWWEKETGLPIPLGCIAIRKDPETIRFKSHVENIIRESIDYAFANPEASREYIKGYAQELKDDVIDNHIKLYVNDFSRSLGAEGYKTIEALKYRAKMRGLL